MFVLSSWGYLLIVISLCRHERLLNYILRRSLAPKINRHLRIRSSSEKNSWIFIRLFQETFPSKTRGAGGCRSIDTSNTELLKKRKKEKRIHENSQKFAQKRPPFPNKGRLVKEKNSHTFQEGIIQMALQKNSSKNF